METDELPGVAEQFANAAKKAIECGFDGIELHGGAYHPTIIKYRRKLAEKTPLTSTGKHFIGSKEVVISDPSKKELAGEKSLCIEELFDSWSLWLGG